MNIQITPEFTALALQSWVKLQDCDNLTLRQYFWFMSDKEYKKYVIEGNYE